jgi:hypothetical protein
MMWRWISGVPSSGSSFSPKISASAGASGQLPSGAMAQPASRKPSIWNGALAAFLDGNVMPAAISSAAPAGVMPDPFLMRAGSSARTQRCVIGGSSEMRPRMGAVRAGRDAGSR